jgi:hypothetical protein
VAENYIIGILVAWIIAAGTAVINKWMPANEKAKLAAEAQIVAQQVANKQGVFADAVKFAEDMYQTVGGDQKRAQAEAWAASKLANLGFNVTAAEIDEGIRIAYQDFAGSAGKLIAAEPIAPATK